MIAERDEFTVREARASEVEGEEGTVVGKGEVDDIEGVKPTTAVAVEIDDTGYFRDATVQDQRIERPLLFGEAD